MKREKKVGSPYSPSKVPRLVEIGGLDYFFRLWKDQHLKKFLMGPLSSHEPFIRSFDSRILNLLPLRNPRRSVRRDSTVILEILVLLAMPIFMHCLNKGSSIGEGSVLAKTMNRSVEVRKEQVENSSDFPYCVPQFKRSLSVERDEKGRTPDSYYFLASNEDTSTGSTREQRHPLVSGRWRVCLVRDSLPSEDISRDETERIQPLWIDRFLEDSNRFFKFYKYAGLTKNRIDFYKNGSDSSFSWKVSNKQDPDRLRTTGLKNDLKIPADSCDKILFESEGGGSVFHPEREAFYELSSFPFCINKKPSRYGTSGLDCHGGGGDPPILQIYSQMRNALIYRLNRFLLIDEESNPISIGTRILGIKNSEKSGKRFPLKMRENYTLILYDYFCGLASKYLFRMKYRLGGWAGSGESTGVTRIAIEERLLEWKDNIERGYFAFQIDEYRDVQSNAHGWLDTIGDSSFSSFGRVSLKLKYDLDKSICGVSKTRSELLGSVGTSINNITRNNEKYPHRFLNVLLLYKTIVTEVTRQKFVIDTIDYYTEKLNPIGLSKLNRLSKLLGIKTKAAQISFLKRRILEGKNGLIVESRSLIVDKKSIGSSISLEPAGNPPLVGLPHIESTRTRFSNDVLSTTGRQIWNLLLDSSSRGRGSNKDINESILRYISDEANTPKLLEHSNSPVWDCARSNFIPRIKRDFFIGRCSSSYPNVLENPYVDSNNEVVSYNTISSIQSQLSNSLSPSLLKRTEGEETVGHVPTTVQLIPSNPQKPATSSSTRSDRIFPFLDLKRLLSGLSSSPHETRDSFLSSCSSDGIRLGKTLRNYNPSADRRPRPRPKSLGLDQVDLEKPIEDGSDSGNFLTQNRFYQNDSSIGSFWEPEELKMLYWSLRFSLRNDVTSRSLIGLKKVSHEDTKIVDPYVRKEPIRPFHLINFNEFSKGLNEYKISLIFWKDNIFEKWSLFREYIPWFFTPNWWRYFYDLIGETYPEVVHKISDDLNYPLPRIYKRISEGVYRAKTYSSQSLRLRFKNDSTNKRLSKIDLILFKEFPNETKMSHSRWLVSQFSNKLILSYFVLSVLYVLVLSKYLLSAVSGSNFLHSWKRFNTIGYLIDPMRGSYLEKGFSSPSTRQMQTRDVLIHYLKRFLNYINNIFFFSFVKNELDLWILCRESSDILNSKKELLTHYLVTNNTISKYQSKSNSNSNFSSSRIDYEPSPQERSDVLAYLPQFCQNDLLSYKIRRLDPAEKWALFALERNLLFSATTRRRGVLGMPCHDIPISLQSGLLPSEGTLLVGPIETGRSSVIRDIASNSYFPLVRLPIRKLLYNRSYLRNVHGSFISRESVRRLGLVFGIAREVSPCTIWIQDIHELNIHRSYHRLEANPRFLLCLILSNIGNERSNSRIRKNIILIASTHVPARVDPALIAPNRLNQLINFRRSNRCQRQKGLSILLRIKGFEIEANSPLLEGTGSGTTGYSKRDLFLFANEALLIGTSRRKKVLCSDVIGLALHRQHSIVTCIGNETESSSEYNIHSHRIVETILKNSLIDTYPTNILSSGSNALKRRFYYLSNWYVEPPITESTIKEFTLFSHIPGLLAGLAARDSFETDMGKKENCIILDKAVENGFNLACGVLENLSKDFPCSEICRSRNQSNQSLSFPFSTEPSYCSDITYAGCSSKSTRIGVFNSLTLRMKQSLEIDSIPMEVSREIAWSPKAWRLSFMRSGTYESIRVLSEFNNLYNIILLYQSQNKIPQRDFELNRIKYSENRSYDKKGYLFGYERALGRLRQRYIKKLEDRLDNLSLREQFLELGISDSSNQYETQWNRSDEPTRFLGGRFVWDPTLLFQPDPNIPSPHRCLLAKQELVRRLYVTYGMRREREKHFSNKKILNFFIYRGYDPKSMTESSVKRCNNFPPDEERHSEYVKETQFMHIHLQYPQTFVPIHLYQNIVIEDLQERFTRFRLLVHRSRWKRNRSPFKDFLIYNMLLETYQYLFDPFQFCETSLDRTTKQSFNESPISYKKP